MRKQRLMRLERKAGVTRRTLHAMLNNGTRVLMMVTGSHEAQGDHVRSLQRGAWSRGRAASQSAAASFQGLTNRPGGGNGSSLNGHHLHSSLSDSHSTLSTDFIGFIYKICFEFGIFSIPTSSVTVQASSTFSWDAAVTS